MKNQFKLDDVVEISDDCPWENIRGRVAFVHQILPNSDCVVTLDSPTMMHEPGSDDLHVTNSFYVPYSCLTLLQDADDDYVQELEDRLIKVEDDLIFTRACLTLSEELREELFKKVKFLQQELDKVSKKE